MITMRSFYIYYLYIFICIKSAGFHLLPTYVIWHAHCYAYVQTHMCVYICVFIYRCACLASYLTTHSIIHSAIIIYRHVALCVHVYTLPSYGVVTVVIIAISR